MKYINTYELMFMETAYHGGKQCLNKINIF